MIIVDRARIDDIGPIQHVLTETWLDTYASSYSAETIREITSTWHAGDLLSRQISNPRVYFGVAQASHRTVVGVVTAKRLDDARSLSLIRLYVLPRYQRRGIGRALLAAASNAFDGVTRLELVVERGNVSGRAFWSTAGFRSVGTKSERIGTVTIEIIAMEKRINQR